jgi:hypothetical protein
MTEFRGFWHGPPLTVVHRACLQSFVNCGHAFELYAYEPIDAGPGIAVKDASLVMARDELFYFFNPITDELEVAPFSDLFRLLVLLEHGGWWCDVDTMCLSRGMPDCRYAWARDNPEFYPDLVANGILRFPPGDRIVQLAFDRACQLKNSLGDRTQLGAAILSPILTQEGMPLDMTISSSAVYPLRWIEMFKLSLPEFAEEVLGKLEPALLLTLCWSFFKYAGIDFGVLPPEGSVLDMLLRKHAGDLIHDGPRYTPDEIMQLTRKWFLKERDWAVPELVAACGPDAARWVLP